MTIYTSIAQNFSTESENRMHSDDTAQGLGFQGALVPGVAILGHMTHPLVERLGERWLSDYWASVRLIKPAYHDDELSIDHTENENGEHIVQCHARGVLLAELHSHVNDDAVDPIAAAPGGPEFGGRTEIEWDDINVGEAFPSWTWRPAADENEAHISQVSETLPLYFNTGIVHPHYILSIANRTFMRRFVLPAWLHVGSEIKFRRLIRIGDSVEVHTVPIEKWRRKGHEFVDLYVSFLVGDEVATEIRHTSIFKIAR